MGDKPEIFLVRHGETEWSKLGKHTGVSDIPLTENGLREAKKLGEKLLRKESFEVVYSSPLLRALETCNASGYGDQVKIDNDLMEWNYGIYEGVPTTEIRKKIPNWTVFTHPVPNGETLEEITARADRIVSKLRNIKTKALLFSSGHILRILTARWLGLSGKEGACFTLSTNSLSILSYERENPVIKLWNKTLEE